MIAARARGGDGAEEEEEGHEDQAGRPPATPRAPPSSPTPPPPASPGFHGAGVASPRGQGGGALGGLGRRLLGSFRALSGIAAAPPSPSRIKAGLGLLLNPNPDHGEAPGDQGPASLPRRRHAKGQGCSTPTPTPPSSADSSFSDALSGFDPDLEKEPEAAPKEQGLGAECFPQVDATTSASAERCAAHLVTDIGGRSAPPDGDVGVAEAASGDELTFAGCEKKGAAFEGWDSDSNGFGVPAQEKGTGAELGANEGEGALEHQEEAGEQEGAIDKQSGPNDPVNVEDQERAVSENAVEAKEVAVVEQDVTDQRDETGHGTAGEGQQKVLEQCTSATDELEATRNDVDALVEDQGTEEHGFTDRRGENTYAIAVGDPEKAEEQCTTRKLEAIRNDVIEDAENHDVIEGWYDTTYDIAVENHENPEEHCTIDEPEATGNGDAVMDQVVVEQDVPVIRDQTGDDIAVEVEEEMVEQCATCELEATGNVGVVMEDQEAEKQSVTYKRCTTKDDSAVDDHEVVVEQYAEELVGQDAINKHGSMLMDDITDKDQEKALEQYASDALMTNKDDNAMEEHREVEEQGVMVENGSIKDNIDVEEQDYAKDQGIIDKWGTVNEVAALEDQKNVAGLCIGDEHIAIKDMVTVRNQENILEQRIGEEEGATKAEYTVEKTEAAELIKICHEWFATADDLAVDTKASEDVSDISSSEAVSIRVNVGDEDKVEKEKVEVCIGYPQRPGRMNCPTYISKGNCPYGVSCCFNHPLGNMLEQRISEEQGATKAEFTVRKHEVLEPVSHQWAAIDDHLAVNTSASGLSDISSFEVVSVSVSSGGGDSMKEIKESDGYPQRPGRMNCPPYMSKGHCPYGSSCCFNHPLGNMLEQRTGEKQGATKAEFTVEKHKVLEPVLHECAATIHDLDVGTAASEGASVISSSEVVSYSVNVGDEGIVKMEKVKVCVGYPQRPGRKNCPTYMSKGNCLYGSSCCFNHPPAQAYSDVASFPPEQGNHRVAKVLELNRVGLPIREGARSCNYYMQNGACRYGKKCQFNHPEQVIDAQFSAPTGWEENSLSSSMQLKKSSDHAAIDDTSYLKKSSDRATFDDTSYSERYSDDAILDATSYSKKSTDHHTLDDTSSNSAVLPPNIFRMLLPPQKLPPNTEEKVVKVKKNSDWSSTSDDSDGCCSADSSDGPLCKQEHVDYPERPGRPECPFYMRYGDCKFAAECKYHHSKGRFPVRHQSKDSLVGKKLREYPERPGEPDCPFYVKSGLCKFGKECKFHHPKDLTPIRRSPTDVKQSVNAFEHRPADRITLEDHLCQQQQYPERPGQPECRYYMQFGKCKYLSACIFHHPKDRLPSGRHLSDPAHSEQDTWQSTNSSRLEDVCQPAQTGPEVNGTSDCPFYMKAGKRHFGSACEFRHMNNRCSSTEGTIDHGADLAYDNFTRSENVLQQQEQAMYPERPGEPDCSYYMRHGSCKYQMNCKYHHPRDRLSMKPYDTTSH